MGIPPDATSGEEGTGGECSNLTRFKWAIKSPSSFGFSSISNEEYLEGEVSVVGGWATDLQKMGVMLI